MSFDTVQGHKFKQADAHGAAAYVDKKKQKAKEGEDRNNLMRDEAVQEASKGKIHVHTEDVASLKSKHVTDSSKDIKKEEDSSQVSKKQFSRSKDDKTIEKNIMEDPGPSPEDLRHTIRHAVEEQKSANKRTVDETRSVINRHVEPAQAFNSQQRTDFTFTISSPAHMPFLKFFREGSKTAECRIDGPGFRNLAVGKTVWFHNRFDGIVCRITFLHRYKSFEDMLNAEGIDNLLPQLKNVNPSRKMEEALRVYRGFPGSHRVAMMGAIAIGVKWIADKIPSGKN